MVGGSVCRTHGGAAPQVREAARRRIIALIPKALYTMSEMMSAESEAVRVRAAIDVLDRAGLKAAEQLTIIPQSAPNEELDAAIIDALRSRGLVTEAMAALQQPQQPQPPAEEDPDEDPDDDDDLTALEDLLPLPGTPDSLDDWEDARDWA